MHHGDLEPLPVRRRCRWAERDPLLALYHDFEWGRPLCTDDEHFERLTLEVFQAGLSWRTILHKREAFRRAFAGFDVGRVAAFNEADAARLMADPGIVRNRAKIEATIANARAFLALQDRVGPIRQWIYALPTDVRAVHQALRPSFRLVGPTTVASYLQAIGRLPPQHEPACWFCDPTAGGDPFPAAAAPPPLLAGAQAVLFDAGDTLIHQWTMKADRLAFLLAQAGVLAPGDGGSAPELARAARANERYFQRRQANPLYGTPRFWLELVVASLRALELSDDLQSLAQRVLAVSRRLPLSFVVDPEAPPLLRALRARGVKIGVVSNWDGTLARVLDEVGLEAYFDVIVDSAEVGVEKPDPGIFDIAVERLGVPRDAVVHIGDSWGADVVGAQAAGLRAVLLDALDCEDRPCQRVTRLAALLH